MAYYICQTLTKGKRKQKFLSYKLPIRLPSVLNKA